MMTQFERHTIYMAGIDDEAANLFLMGYEYAEADIQCGIVDRSHKLVAHPEFCRGYERAIDDWKAVDGTFPNLTF